MKTWHRSTLAKITIILGLAGWVIFAFAAYKFLTAENLTTTAAYTYSAFSPQIVRTIVSLFLVLVAGVFWFVSIVTGFIDYRRFGRDQDRKIALSQEGFVIGGLGFVALIILLLIAGTG